jgi:hypothetical protein
MREGCCAQVSFDGWGQARGPGVSGQEWVWDVGAESDVTGSTHWPRSIKASCEQRGMVIGGRNQMSQHRLLWALDGSHEALGESARSAWHVVHLCNAPNLNMWTPC